MTARTRAFLILVCLIGAATMPLFLSRDGVGIFVFLAFGAAALAQLGRVAFGSGNRTTLKQLWSAFKDAFWGIG
jgi:hypothetical protein